MNLLAGQTDTHTDCATLGALVPFQKEVNVRTEGTHENQTRYDATARRETSQRSCHPYVTIGTPFGWGEFLSGPPSPSMTWTHASSCVHKPVPNSSVARNICQADCSVMLKRKYLRIMLRCH